MPQSDWQPVVQKRDGNPRQIATYKFEPAFIRALRRYASEETQQAGFKVSQAQVLERYALESSSRLFRLYQDEKTSKL